MDRALPPCGDADDLERFVRAQAPVWDAVQDELRSGRKRSHWMWFVFPQLRGLGRSAMAWQYGLRDADEARRYLAHPVLGPRLAGCVALLLALPPGPAAAVLGEVDALKLRSCLSLFAAVAPQEPLFAQGLARWFGGLPDPATLALLGTGARPGG
jgi:uncharacterized protein (DUF1810 family)